MSSQQYEFIRLYNEVHDILKAKLHHYISNNDNANISFSELISALGRDAVKHEFPYLAQFRNKLDLINNFRNTIIHRQTEEFYNIAEPSQLTMDTLKEIIAAFVTPLRIKDYIEDKRTLITFNANDTLSDVLQTIHTEHLSQFPVFKDDLLIGLITENGIANFIAEHNESGNIHFKKHTVLEIINAYDENSHAYSPLTMDLPLFDVLDNLYAKRSEKTFKYILITTKSGKNITRESLVTIFTAHDIPKIVNALNTHAFL